MHILVIGGSHVEAEFRAKFGPAHAYTFLRTEHAQAEEWQRIVQQVEAELSNADVAFCFSNTEQFASLLSSLSVATFPVFTEVFEKSLLERRLSTGKCPPILFGFCGLPTLLNRPLLEVSLCHEADREKLAETCTALGTDYRVVADRVGLVTPRVVSQIINEACFTVQEGTATMQDVDLGMKLGTNYPKGPFAWANDIGVGRVYALLEAMWNDTHDERYKVCPLLKQQALRGQSFEV